MRQMWASCGTHGLTRSPSQRSRSSALHRYRHSSRRRSSRSLLQLEPSSHRFVPQVLFRLLPRHWTHRRSWSQSGQILLAQHPVTRWYRQRVLRCLVQEYHGTDYQHVPTFVDRSTVRCRFVGLRSTWLLQPQYCGAWRVRQIHQVVQLAFDCSRWRRLHDQERVALLGL